MSQRVGIREAKARLSGLLADVRRGETVTITDRGRAVARLVPVRIDESSLPSRIRQLEDLGWISGPCASASPCPPPVRLASADVAQRYLSDDRDGD